MDGSGNVRTNTYEVGQTGATTTYAFDANGNMTSDGTKTYVWDAENRLTEVRQGATTLASFVYDGRGRRQQKMVGGVTHTYISDGSGLTEERVSTGQTLRYVEGRGIDQHLAMQDGGVVTYYLADHLRSVVQESNTGGAVTLSRKYDAWGNLIAGGATAGWAFTGRDWDPEVGLAYYRARYYDPKVGRFASEDPIRFRGGNNFYAYVHDNPVRFRDPHGLWAAGGGAGVNGAAAAGPMGIAGEADCKAVGDGHGNVGLLCCAGAGPAVGFAEEIGVAATGIFCFSCKTICDLEGMYVTAQAGGGAGAGMSGSGGGSVGSEQLAVVGSIGPSEAAGGTGGCKLVTSTISCSSCGK